ncbi:MAG: hypothetical protein J0I12_11105 [Candidatus Eremiobacteraeota bacterium]|nr:hypothetical protein [Candidatus Eremiobacteraeota bacterium]
MGRFVELLQSGGGSRYGEGVFGLSIYGGGDAVVQLPVGLVLKDNSFEAKIDRQDLMFADGRVSYGEEIEERKLVVEGYVDADDRAAHLALMNQIRYQACLPGQRLRINTGHYINLARLRSLDDEPVEGMDRTVARVKIEWQVDDPFWYAESEETRTFAMGGNGSFQIDLSSLPNCHRGQHPQITISSPVFLPVGTSQITNVTDGGLTCRYGDPYLGFGNSATIDCVAGTVTRLDGTTKTNTIRYFEGEFLRMVPGLNDFSYVGPACTLTFKWRPRWL